MHRRFATRHRTQRYRAVGYHSFAHSAAIPSQRFTDAHSQIVPIRIQHRSTRAKTGCRTLGNASQYPQSKFEWACMNSTIRMTSSCWEMGVRQCAPLGK
jgi:hypothetical protein